MHDLTLETSLYLAQAQQGHKHQARPRTFSQSGWAKPGFHQLFGKFRNSLYNVSLNYKWARPGFGVFYHLSPKPNKYYTSLGFTSKPGPKAGWARIRLGWPCSITPQVACEGACIQVHPYQVTTAAAETATTILTRCLSSNLNHTCFSSILNHFCFKSIHVKKMNPGNHLS